MSDIYIKGTLEGLQELIFECNTDLIKDLDIKNIVILLRLLISLIEKKFDKTLNKKELCNYVFNNLIKGDNYE